jgi:hypothetical protein
MLSIIICSIRPELSENLRKNIDETIGIEHEIIIFDNREFRYGICKVYNSCAEKARYPFLCFLHEDVFIHTMNWGREICNFLKNEEVGVVGFAGGLVKSSMPSLWGTTNEYSRMYFIDGPEKSGHFFNLNPQNESYARVLCLDGFCMFVSKVVWGGNLFDENTFRKFHSYDVDFTFSVARRLKNYVCYTISITHFSKGNFNDLWLHENEKFIDKWRDELPCSILPLSSSELQRVDNHVLYNFLRFMINRNFPVVSVNKYLRMYFDATKVNRQYFKIIFKYLFYRLLFNLKKSKTNK